MNQKVKLEDIRTLSHEKYLLRTITFSKQKMNGSWERHHREVFDHGDAVTVLLYNKQKRTLIFVRQFRVVVYMDKEPSGMLLETCAGLLEGGEPREVIIREIEEETGYHITQVQQVYVAYSSAGSLSEKLYYFIAEYNDGQKKSSGGGLEQEQEEVEVIEMPFDEAIALLNEGKIQDVKMIVLLQYAIIHKLFD